MLFSFDETKLHSPTFPFAKPTASSKSPALRNDGATQRIYWYLVSDADSVAVVACEISKFMSKIEQKTSAVACFSLNLS